MQGGQWAAGAGIPQSDGLAKTQGGNRLAVGGKGERTIGDEIRVPAPDLRPARHVANRAFAVGVMRVTVEHTTDVGALQQSRKHVPGSSIDLAFRLA